MEAVLHQWKANGGVDFNLEGLRTTLDAQASGIGDYQDASSESRKKLAEATKMDVKLKSVGPLLKSYQEEIDRLTLRSSFAEKAFLALYKPLSELPDPVLGLNRATEELQQVGKVGELEAENRRLQKEVEEFHKEFQEIQNQEVTVRRLEERLREYEGQMEELVADKERIAESQRQLASARAELLAVRQAYDAAQASLFDLKLRHDDEQAARQAQVELLFSEVERANASVLSLERERDKLKEQLSAERHLSVAPPEPDLEIAVAQKDIEVATLQEQVQQLQASLSQGAQAREAATAALQAQVQEQKAEIDALHKQLHSAPSASQMQEMKKQLQMLKSMELDMSESDPIGEKTVLKLLKEKSRRLETESIQLKARGKQVEEELGHTKQQLEAAEEKLKEQSRLISRLEEDIASAHRAGPPPAQSAPAVEESSGGGGGGGGKAMSQPSAGSASDDISTVTEIIRSQRDRFKMRVGELETEARKLRDQLADVQEEISSLRGDNLKLYQKIRYLSSYNPRQGKTAGDPEDPSELKYRNLYEDSVNPFTLFNRKEKQERYKGLNTAEKVTLHTGRFFLANKYSRTFIFFYALALHLLVFLTLYKLANTATLRPAV
ncbi:protein casp, putative [Acanthamoeba castellanii str. Neff]|uniref:Protein CASP n=1 Tax=Acanthamoeba castellanii (strain ATCC 30010 / Neff) TaxID=1257118 RepID=L8HI28_ACACF|nr:protein casp, putative [Acanthamoeba castellanii str. Neff]ELR24051.1 protein casp, putative [Acanthamoeba castellanii str. Neff]